MVMVIVIIVKCMSVETKLEGIYQNTLWLVAL